MTGYDSEEYNAIMEEYHATKDLAQKTALLQKAEELLMKDLPVIPVIYNQNAIMVSDDLSNVNPNFYVPAYFKKAKQKNYELYTETTIG
jgi:oligopeptide transport system substrate-binding protein